MGNRTFLYYSAIIIALNLFFYFILHLIIDNVSAPDWVVDGLTASIVLFTIVLILGVYKTELSKSFKETGFSKALPKPKGKKSGGKKK